MIRSPFLLPGAALALLAAFATSCLYDASDRCSKNQVYDAKSESCICTADAPPLGGACVPCAANDTRAACKTGPSGYGTACTTDQDCAGFDASHCETLQAHVCVVSPCQKSPDSCTGGQTCCDLSSLGIPLSLCTPAGQCPVQ
jgi:hypothetical protein